MRNKFLPVFIAIVCLLGVSSGTSGKYKNIKSESSLSKILRNPRYNLAIALFYDAGKIRRDMDPDTREAIEMNRAAKNMFKSASKMFTYNDADLIFLAINTRKRKTVGMDRSYGITEVPTFMLFKDGVPYKDSTGRVVAKTGFFERPALEKFINTHFKDFIEKNRKRNAEIRRRKAEERSFYWGWGWGYPYYGGYGYPYYGYPYYWGYPYYRGYYPYYRGYYQRPYRGHYYRGGFRGRGFRGRGGRGFARGGFRGGGRGGRGGGRGRR